MSILKSSLSRLPKYQRFSYRPRYFDPSIEEKVNDGPKIKFKRKHLFNSGKSNIAGELRNSQVLQSYKTSQKRGIYKLILLTAMLALAGFFYLGKLSGVLTIIFVFILLVLFIRENNKL